MFYLERFVYRNLFLWPSQIKHAVNRRNFDLGADLLFYL